MRCGDASVLVEKSGLLKRGRMRRGDTAMWVLTKMAMLFFIAALAAILLVFGGYERTGLCNEEARAISSRVAAGFTQLLNTPLEDERRVIQLESSLALGESRRARYAMHLTRRELTRQPFNAIVINAVSEADPNCNAGVQVTYPREFDAAGDKRLYFFPSANPPQGAPRSITSIPGDSSAKERMTLKPAPLSTEKEGERTTFIALLKCTQKKTQQVGGRTIGGKSYFFIQDCTRDDANKCINLESIEFSVQGAGDIKTICGFG